MQAASKEVFRTIIILVTRGHPRLHFKTVIFCFATSAFAHELSVTTRVAGPSVILCATYAGSDPVPFAKVQVYAPTALPAKEFQAANTDRRGCFSFVPDGVGLWRVIVDDELGHRREVSVDITALASQPVESQGNPSRIERALLGISLLIGLTGFWYGYQANRRSQMRP